MKRRECIFLARVESALVNRRRISSEELEELVSQQDALKAQLQTMYDTPSSARAFTRLLLIKGQQEQTFRGLEYQC